MHSLSVVAAKQFANRFINKFIADDTPTLAASLAFYAALSLAPLVILFVSISAQLNETLQISLIHEVQDMFGDDAAQAMQIVINGAKSRPDLTSFAGLMGALTLLISASLVFGQLRTTLHRIFYVSDPIAKTASYFYLVKTYISRRLIQIISALGFLLALITALLISLLVLGYQSPETSFLAVFGNITLLAFLLAIVFGTLFRFLSNRKLTWSEALKGGTLTSVLFAFGKELIGLYLSQSALGTPYGAAGSLIVLMAWVYYSAIITFVGAQVSSLLGNISPHRT